MVFMPKCNQTTLCLADKKIILEIGGLPIRTPALSVVMSIDKIFYLLFLLVLVIGPGGTDFTAASLPFVCPRAALAAMLPTISI